MNFILNTQSQKVLFIFDGLDEFNLETNKSITRIMEQIQYKKSTCIITTRPEVADKVKHWRHVIYKQAELLGFCDENIQMFIEKFFRSHEEGEKIADELYNLIFPIFESTPDFDCNINPFGEIDELQNLASNPGRLGMLCSIYSYNKELVTNTAKLYEEYVIIMLSEWEKKQDKPQTPKAKILDKYKDVLYQFGKLAYKQEDNGDLKLTFAKEEVKECISPELYNCGFMYKPYPLHRLEDCHLEFIHTSLQEYLAAYYVIHDETGHALDDLLKDFTSEEKTVKVAPVLKFAFYCGLSNTKIQHVIDYCIHNSDGNHVSMFYMLKFLDLYSSPLQFDPVFLGSHELVNIFIQLPACIMLTKLSESTFRSGWRGIKQSDDQKSWILKWPSDTKNCFIVDHFPNEEAYMGSADNEIAIFYLHRWPLFINGESESINKILLATSGNVHITNVCKNVTTLDLGYSKIHLKSTWLNNLLLKVPNCAELNMESCGLSDEDIKHLCEETKGRDLNIEILNLENNDVITEEPDVLVRFIRQCPCLRELYLTSNEIPEEEVTQDDIIKNVMNIVLLVNQMKSVVEDRKMFVLYLDGKEMFINESLYTL